MLKRTRYSLLATKGRSKGGAIILFRGKSSGAWYLRVGRADLCSSLDRREVARIADEEHGTSFEVLFRAEDEA